MERNPDFTVSREWCGYRAKRWVVRFRGTCTGQAWTRAGAWRLASRLQRARLSLGRKHWEWRITEEAEAAFASMRQVVEYNWADEVEDFDAQDEDGQRGHIYQHLERVDGFLSSYEC